MSYTNLLKSLIPASTLLGTRKTNKPVNITPDIKSVVVKHKKHNMLVKREADNDARIPEMYTKTSRPCPPFCIQPMYAVEGVETIGELEVLEYLAQTTQGSDNILIIDSRMEDWVVKGTIPGAINIPWTQLSPDQGASIKNILRLFKHQFGVQFADNISIEDIKKSIVEHTASRFFDFSKAKTLILFCNGTWCGQTSVSIRALVAFGYPVDKLKYFRNGMQGWVDLGLTTVSQEDDVVTDCKIQ